MPSLRVFFSYEKNVFFSCFTWPGPRLPAHGGAVKSYSKGRRARVVAGVCGTSMGGAHVQSIPLAQSASLDRRRPLISSFWGYIWGYLYGL